MSILLQHLAFLIFPQTQIRFSALSIIFLKYTYVPKKNYNYSIFYDYFLSKGLLSLKVQQCLSTTLISWLLMCATHTLF